MKSKVEAGWKVQRENSKKELKMKSILNRVFRPVAIGGVSADHDEDLPSDFPKTADWLQEMSKSQYADDLPWAACIPFLVDGEYLRLYQIEDIREEELMRICGAVIKLPTARLMIKYASQECRRIHIEKAHLRR